MDENKSFERYNKLGIAALIVVGIGIILFIGSVFLFPSVRSFVFPPKPIAQQTYATSTIEISGTKIIVELADTPALRTLGLSGHKNLENGQGMLFLFDESGNYGFWMKDMKFSIDVIWIDAAKNIVHIEKNITPESYPTVFESNAPAKYALEVPAGFSDTHSFTQGDSVKFFIK